MFFSIFPLAASTLLDVVICSILSLRPELKSGEQICRLFNEVDVIRSKRPALPPNL